MPRLISFELTDLRCQPREESENYKMKNSCPQRDWNPSNLYRYKYGYRLPLNIHSHKSPWLSRLERHSSKPEVVGSNPTVGKNFSFCNSRSLHVADTSNQSIQMKSTVAYT